MIKAQVIIITVLLSAISLSAQTKKVFFVGNSYTATNNLPQMIHDLAISSNDTLIYGSNTPGGTTLIGHSSLAASTDPIKLGGYDYVVLQDQSQLWSFPQSQVNSQATPYVKFFDSLIKVHNASTCGQTLLYMTWGRQNGDASNCASWPPVCTYSGMDSLLRLRAIEFQNMFNTSISPVGAVWRYIRTNYPSINLYVADESHPSLEGSYAAACTFYALIFKKDPSALTANLGVSSTSATQIRNAAKIIAYDSLFFWDKFSIIKANFTNTITNKSVSFTNISTNAFSYKWDFGDGSSINTGNNPTYTYSQNGNYTVKLIVFGCSNKSDTFSKNITIQDVSTIPILTIGSSSDILSNSAKISSTIIVKSTNSANLSFEYGKTISFGSSIASTPNTATGNNSTNVTASLTGLEPNTKYYYRLKAVINSQNYFSKDSFFTTSPLQDTNVSFTILYPVSITTSSAVLKGQVNVKNLGTYNVSFDYGKTTNYTENTISSPSTASGASNINIQASISNLQPNTKYFYRIKAEKNGVSKFSKDSFFFTSDLSLISNLANDGILIYPNPVKHTLRLKGLKNNRYDYSVIDIHGRTLFKGPVTSDKSISLEGLSSGEYFLQLKDGITDKITFHKFYIED